MNKRYGVRLSANQRRQVEQLVKVAKVAGYNLPHANMLLMADADGPAMTDPQISKALGVSVAQMENLRRRLVEEGLHACLSRRPQERPSIEPIFDGEKEDRLIAMACGKPPEAYGQWSLRLLADRALELKIVASTSHEAVRRVL
ncbi:MAG: helix-turn-helix domain-containing protein [Planctomycetota bacterium]|nr:helix-turn-helix domain-containing protein [Planctomycetota bacterium]